MIRIAFINLLLSLSFLVASNNDPAPDGQDLQQAHKERIDAFRKEMKDNSTEANKRMNQVLKKKVGLNSELLEKEVFDPSSLDLRIKVNRPRKTNIQKNIHIINTDHDRESNYNKLLIDEISNRFFGPSFKNRL